jgi:hypothetical protein
MITAEHTDALLSAIQERMGPVLVDLLAVLERVRRRLAQLNLTPDKIYPGELNGMIDQILTEMAVAARRAVRAGSDRDVVSEMLSTRQDRVGVLATALKDRPSLARGLAILRAAAGMASGLQGLASDELVAADTAKTLRGLQRPDQVAMWVPERDACARCLRYAGLRLIRPGDRFPAGLSYDPAQADSDAGKVSGPPLHPHCRCELQLISKGQSEDASKALQREAQRSILKGWSLPSEGDASRRRAAAALVGKAELPKSVKAEARKRLAEGPGFTRDVPTGNESAAEKAFLRSYSEVYR